MRAVVLVLLAGCGAGDLGDGPRSAAHQACVDATNELRQQNGRSTLDWSAPLEDFAQDGAAYDHDREPHDHFISTGGGGIAHAENECPRWGLDFGGGTLVGLVEACIDAFYSEGPGGGHYENLLGDHATVACGIHERDGAATIVQDFGP